MHALECRKKEGYDMPLLNIPTSKDIFIEINGKKIATVESYKAKSTRESKYVEAFGETEPIGAVGGRVRHVLEVSRIYMETGSFSDGIDFFGLSNFNLVVVKPDRRIIYSGCEWASIGENVSLNDVILENVTILAAKRMELTS
jgi:hypothetical protein